MAKKDRFVALLLQGNPDGLSLVEEAKLAREMRTKSREGSTSDEGNKISQQVADDTLQQSLVAA